MLIAWALAWAATKPTTSSPDAVGVTAPELAAVLVLAVPAETSSGEVVDTPENSWTEIATTLVVCTVTLVTAVALARYHISPSELWPAEKYAPILVQEAAPDSVTADIGPVAPV